MAGRPATLKVDIVADAKGVDKGAGEAESRFGRMGSKFKTFGLVAAAGVGVAAAAVVGLGKEVVDAASDQQQAFGALQSIYGKNAGQVTEWAKHAATNLGLTATEYANLSSLVGSQLKNMGRSQGQAAKDSDKLIHTGADLAATFGGSVSDAVEAVSSLLKGESDPIERYGVSINQTAVQAELAAEGHNKLTGAALKTASANATLTLLTRQTAAAHGSFAKESNTLAGQQERLKAQFENTKATVGTKLLPILTKLTTFANTGLFPALKAGGLYLQQHLGPAFRAVGSFVTGSVVPAFQRFGKFITGTIVPIIRSYGTPILNQLRAAFANVQAAVQRNRPQLAAVGSALKTVASAVGVVVVWLAKHLAPILGTIIGTGFKLLGATIGGVIGTIGRFVGGIQDAVRWVKNLYDKISSLASKASSIHLPDLNPFGAAGVVGMVPGGLAGAAPGYGPAGGFTTAALGDLAFASASASALRGGAAYVVDRRDFRTYLTTGDVLDGPGAARKLQTVLGEHATRMRRDPALKLGRS